MTGKESRFKVAAVQLSPVLFDRDATTEQVLKAIEGCGREGVQLAVFPETIIPEGDGQAEKRSGHGRTLRQTGPLQPPR